MRRDNAPVLSKTNSPAFEGVDVDDDCCDALGVGDREVVAEKVWLSVGGKEAAPDRVCEADGVAKADPLAVTLRVPEVVTEAVVEIVRV